MREQLLNVMQIAKDYLPEFLKKYPALEGRSGLFFLVSHGKISLGETLTEGEVLGHLTDEKEPVYMFNAMEKITRIKTRQNNDFSEYTSFPSANNQSTWGGGINPKGTQWHLAASGLPPEYDHLFCIDVLLRAGMISQEKADELHAEVPREIWEKVLVVAAN